MTNNIPDFRNHFEAFDNALDKGTFTEDLRTSECGDGLYIFDWMYMHSDKTKKIDYFKNKLTRKYIEVAYV